MGRGEHGKEGAVSVGAGFRSLLYRLSYPLARKRDRIRTGDRRINGKESLSAHSPLILDRQNSA